MVDGPGPLRQEAIDELLQSAGSSGRPESAAGPMSADAESLLASSVGASGGSLAASGGGPSKSTEGVAPRDIDFLLNQAEQALASIQQPGQTDTPPGAVPFRLTEFSGAPPSTDNATLDLLRDVDLDLRIELGRTQMYLEDVLKLSKGAVVPLDKLAGDPVDIYANGRLIARGEVLILNDNFCVRVAELVAGEAPAG